MRDYSEFNHRLITIDYGPIDKREGVGWVGRFVMRSSTDGDELRIIASTGLGWDHVSVSHIRRIPNWLEMEQVARVFFKDDEYAMQLHVPTTAHINVHPFVLHWWRPQDVAIPTPPKKLV